MKYYTDGQGGEPHALIRVYSAETDTAEQFLAARAEWWLVNTNSWGPAPSGPADIIWTGDYDRIPADQVSAAKTAIAKVFRVAR
jgi:hypothetical protein